MRDTNLTLAQAVTTKPPIDLLDLDNEPGILLHTEGLVAPVYAFWFNLNELCHVCVKQSLTPLLQKNAQPDKNSVIAQ